MEIEKLFDKDVDGIADNIFGVVNNSVNDVREMQKRKVAENVQIVINALKKIESDIRDRMENVGGSLEKRILSIKDGRDGIDGKDGRDGKDGKQGKDGRPGRDGKDGKNGLDGQNGEDGISVVNAHIDFDGSLIITLSSGKEINVGEVVASDIAEKIKVITNGGGTSQSVLDTLDSLQAQITALDGFLDYKGTWNASTNSPTLVSSTGTKGDYYVVSVAGSTTLNGESNWGVGDWVVFNNSTWQKVDGGSTGNFITVSASTSVTTPSVTNAGTLALSATGANITTFSTNSSERMRIDSSGNVGIGTSSPGAKLNVVTTGTTLANFTGAEYSQIRHSDGVRALYTQVYDNLAVIGVETATTPLAFVTNSAERMRIDSSGNVGIGTSSPGGKLHAAVTDASTVLKLERTGAGATSYTADFSGATFNQSISGGADFVWIEGGAEWMRLTNTGNVGIGTSSPTAKLDVSSDVFRLRTAKTPASASATGNAGDICWDSSYIYVCTATNTWKRVAIATW